MIVCIIIHSSNFKEVITHEEVISRVVGAGTFCRCVCR